jgi:hypothetical protein
MNTATLKSLVGLLSSPVLTPAQHEMYAKILLTLSTNGTLRHLLPSSDVAEKLRDFFQINKTYEDILNFWPKYSPAVASSVLAFFCNIALHRMSLNLYCF